MIISDSAIFQRDNCDMRRLHGTSDKPMRSLYIHYFDHLSYPLQLYDLSHCPKWRIQFGPCNWSAKSRRIIAGSSQALSQSFSSSWEQVSVILKTTSSVPSCEKKCVIRYQIDEVMRHFVSKIWKLVFENAERLWSEAIPYNAPDYRNRKHDFCNPKIENVITKIQSL